MDIIKAELLWSRKCPLKCSYCAMADGRDNTPSIEEWKKGIDNLKKLGCSFIAFYGAEPLVEFDKLPEVIQHAEVNGIHTTVITSGAIDHLDNKLQILHEHGLRSITTSYDSFSNDHSSQIKTNNALKIIDSFRRFSPIRDCAVVMTLTRENFQYLPEVITKMSSQNIWTFFDIIHPNRNQPGSKVKNTDLNLLFGKGDVIDLVEVLTDVYDMKENGYLCHASKPFIAWLKTDLFGNSLYSWNCAVSSFFPSWVTIDCDGTAKACDDFFTKNGKEIKVWDLFDNWKTFQNIWRDNIYTKCPGCLWNTHYDAHLIKAGKLPLSEYIHGLEE